MSEFMPIGQFGPSDPIADLSWLSRLRWRLAERRVRKGFERDTLAELRRLAKAGSPLEVRAGGHRRGGLVRAAEFTVGGRRVVAACVWGPAWDALRSAGESGTLRFAGAGRYQGSWTLRFDTAGGPGSRRRAGSALTLLASRVRIVPDDGGSFLGRSLPPVLTPAGV